MNPKNNWNYQAKMVDYSTYTNWNEAFDHYKKRRILTDTETDEDLSSSEFSHIYKNSGMSLKDCRSLLELAETNPVVAEMLRQLLTYATLANENHEA